MIVTSARIRLDDLLSEMKAIDPRPNPSPDISNITVFYRDGSDVILTEAFLLHCLDLLHLDRVRRGE